MGWNIQSINKGGVSTGPGVVTVGAVAIDGHELCVTAYNDQLHFTYIDADGAVQDVWQGSDREWHLQQIAGTPVPGEYYVGVEVSSGLQPSQSPYFQRNIAPAAAGNLFVSVYRAGTANSDRGISGGSVLRQPKMAEKRRADE
ncbi:MAG: hypothetical protein ABR987_07070 [Terracidiphilus sp.]|jgi:hypothetical protein